MTDSLAHRGPDGEGFFLSGPVALGHRRLSIIDVDGGAQPIANEDGTLQVVLNGEIYNFIELRRELQGFGHVFRTRSDTEVIVHAYEQWGIACVDHLNGMFAFAIFDSVRRSVFVARDHLGIKPLYYAVVGTQVLFASEIKALLQDARLRRQVDLGSLGQLFTFRHVPSPNTLFEGIFRLPPGHHMRICDGGVEVSRYWKVIPTFRKAWREADLIAEYQALFEDAVRLQLRSDVPLGLFLSSGVDSGALLAVMAEHSSKPIETFTIGFEGADSSNEVDDARLTARQFGANHSSRMLGCNDYLRYFERYMSDLEEPVADEPAPAFYFLSQMTSRHVKVALTGQGADEPWAGYDRYLGVRLSSIYSRLPDSVTKSFAPWVGRLPLPMERFKRGIASLAEPDLLTRFSKIYSFFTADMKSQLFRGELQQRYRSAPDGNREALRELQSHVAHLDPLSQMLYIDTRANLPDDLLMVADKTSMANALEVRVPFLDRRLVEFVETLPPRLKLHGMTGKYLHKKAMTKWLPRDVVYRKKKGFAHPVASWLRTSMKPLIEDCLLSPRSSIAQYFDRKYMRHLVVSHQEGREQHMRHLYLLVSLELWHRQFIDA